MGGGDALVAEIEGLTERLVAVGARDLPRATELAIARRAALDRLRELLGREPLAAEAAGRLRDRLSAISRKHQALGLEIRLARAGLQNRLASLASAGYVERAYRGGCGGVR